LPLMETQWLSSPTYVREGLRTARYNLTATGLVALTDSVHNAYSPSVQRVKVFRHHWSHRQSGGLRNRGSSGSRDEYEAAQSATGTSRSAWSSQVRFADHRQQPESHLEDVEWTLHDPKREGFGNARSASCRLDVKVDAKREARLALSTLWTAG
jgi:hypothetical protein